MSVVVKTETDHFAHIQGHPTGTYETLCGLDGTFAEDEGGMVTEYDSERKVDCETCKNIWLICSHLKAGDFQ